MSEFIKEVPASAFDDHPLAPIFLEEASVGKISTERLLELRAVFNLEAGEADALRFCAGNRVRELTESEIGERVNSILAPFESEFYDGE